MFKKLFSILSLSFLSFLFFVPLASAANVDPVNNPICWSKNDCQEAFKTFHWIWDEKKFSLGGPDNICGSNLGVCVPAGQAEVEIKIGGKVKFTDLGDYTKTVYTWVLSIGGVVAVVLVIVGGFRYMTSAGSSERVRGAKQTISSALLGLFFLLSSYTLLYTINPDLLYLKMPQVYMIRGDVISDFCRTKGPLLDACKAKGPDYTCEPFMAKGPGIQLGESYLGGMVTLLTAGGFGGGLSGVIKSAPKAANFAKGIFKDVAFKGNKAALNYIEKDLIKASNQMQRVTSALGGLSMKVAAKNPRIVGEVGNIIAGSYQTGKQITFMSLKSVAGVGAAAYAGEKIFESGVNTGMYLKEEWYDFFNYNSNVEGLAGVCRQSHKLADGLPCNSLMPDPGDCASGKCADFNFLSGWMNGIRMGFCTGGNFRQSCVDSGDCQSGYKCINQICSDGSAGSSCNSQTDCVSGLNCITLIGGNQCYVKGSGEIDDVCNIAFSNGEDGGCKAGLTCARGLKAGPDATSLGVCTDQKTDSPCFYPEDCLSKFCKGSDVNNRVPGVCTTPPLKEREPCTDSSQCGAGGKCVVIDPSTSNAVCSKGRANSPCSEDDDCGGDKVNSLLCMNGQKCGSIIFNASQPSKGDRIPKSGDISQGLCTENADCFGAANCIKDSFGAESYCVTF